METVFVDTGAWFALADRSDAHHREAVEIMSALHAQWRLLTTNLVVAESHVLILRTLGYEAALAFLDGIEGSSRTRKVCSDKALETSAGEILRRYRDQDFSFTDAVSFALMKREGIRQAFTFDGHFLVAGFTPMKALSKNS